LQGIFHFHELHSP